jgi:hypothetical protein
MRAEPGLFCSPRVLPTRRLQQETAQFTLPACQRVAEIETIYRRHQDLLSLAAGVEGCALYDR